MIIVAHKSMLPQSLLKKYPDAIIIDVTSKASDEFVQFSPFYPHGNIPVPFSEKCMGKSVEGIWQGLKVFESEDIDIQKFEVENMKGLKRTVKRFGKCLGHRKGIQGTELLGYAEARKQIYLPLYRWFLENKAEDLLEKLQNSHQKGTFVLLDYETNGDIENLKKPLSHAHLIKQYLEEHIS